MNTYIDHSFYTSIYGDIPEADFNRLLWDSQRRLDNETTGIDGYRKLQEAFPTNEYDNESVKRCLCKLVDTAKQIEEAEESARNARGYVQRTDGSYQSKIVASASAGNESISYASGSSSATITAIDTALANFSEREKLYHNIIVESLMGIKDANGINLLYMGRYPHIEEV